MKDLLRILYVEDEEDIQAVARVALETIGGFEVKICSSGIQAIEAVSDFRPQLIVLDVMMPIMGGVETMEKIKELPDMQDIPFIFMTAKVYQDEIQQFKEQGAWEVIAKPFDPIKLSVQLKEIWESHLRAQEHM